MSDSKYAIRICEFSTTDELRGKHLTYENLKAVVLKTGKFSVFEATETQKRARLFERLCQDPEIELINKSYPWTLVRLKNVSDEKR
jgi:hypothetical protein